MVDFILHARNSEWDLVPNELKESADFLNAAARESPRSIRRSGYNKHPNISLLTEETILAAIDVDNAGVNTLMSNLLAIHKTEAVCLAACRVSWRAYYYVPTRANTAAVRTAAMTTSPLAFEFFNRSDISYEFAILWHAHWANRDYLPTFVSHVGKCISNIIGRVPITLNYLMMAVNYGFVTRDSILGFERNFPPNDPIVNEIEVAFQRRDLPGAGVNLANMHREIIIAREQVLQYGLFREIRNNQCAIGGFRMKTPVITGAIVFRIPELNPNYRAELHERRDRLHPPPRLHPPRLHLPPPVFIPPQPPQPPQRLPRNYADDRGEVYATGAAEKRAAAIVSSLRGPSLSLPEPRALIEAGETRFHAGERLACFVCMNDFVDREQFVQCGCGEAHAFCFACFEFAVRVQCGTKAETFNPTEWRANQGRVACRPGANVFSDSVIARACPEHIGIYMNSRIEFNVVNANERASACSAEIAALAAESALKAFISPAPICLPAAVKHIQDYILTRRCPACKGPFSDFTDCSSVLCDCGAHFCGLCLGFHSPDKHEAHRHVLTCQFNPSPGSSYAFVDKTVLQNIAVATGYAVINYIAALAVDNATKCEIAFAVAKDAADSHVPGYLLNAFIETLC